MVASHQGSAIPCAPGCDREELVVGVGIRRDSIHRGYSSIGEAKSVGSSRIRRTRLLGLSLSFFFFEQKNVTLVLDLDPI